MGYCSFYEFYILYTKYTKIVVNSPFYVLVPQIELKILALVGLNVECLGEFSRVEVPRCITIA